MAANQKVREAGVTLVELLVVIIIVAILSALTLGGLRSGAVRAKEGATRLLVTKLSDAVMELLEELEDRGFDALDTSAMDLYRQLPDTSAFASHSNPPFGPAYTTYASTIGTQHQAAECLYMIISQTGLSRTLMETLHAADVGDTDGNGANEFLDAWGQPISFSFSPPNPRLTIAQPRQLPRIWSFGPNGSDETGSGDDIQNIYVPTDPSEPGFFIQ